LGCNPQRSSLPETDNGKGALITLRKVILSGAEEPALSERSKSNVIPRCCL
jgi:hypothetical protein